VALLKRNLIKWNCTRTLWTVCVLFSCVCVCVCVWCVLLANYENVKYDGSFIASSAPFTNWRVALPGSPPPLSFVLSFYLSPRLLPHLPPPFWYAQPAFILRVFRSHACSAGVAADVAASVPRLVNDNGKAS